MTSATTFIKVKSIQDLFRTENLVERKAANKIQIIQNKACLKSRNNIKMFLSFQTHISPPPLSFFEIFLTTVSYQSLSATVITVYSALPLVEPQNFFAQ